MNSLPRQAVAHRLALGLMLALLGGILGSAPPAGAVVPATAPVVRTAAATGITQTAATLTATVNPGGLPATYFFQYGTTVAYGAQTRIVNLPAGSAPVAVNGPIAGLVAGTRYHFRIVAINALGKVMGADASFATSAPPPAPRPPAPKPPAPKPPAPKPPAAKAPIVRTGGATAITGQSASLTGFVNPSGQPATYYFQYGTTAKYGSHTAPAPLAAGTATDPVAGAIGGLVPGTRYHYRLVAANAAGTAIGADAAFMTPVVPLSLAIRGLPNPVTFGAPVNVVGTIAGTGGAGRAVTLQANPYPYTGGFHNVGNPQATSRTGAFQFNLTLPSTTQLRAVSLAPGSSIVSPTVTERVALAVTTSVTVTRTRGRSYSFAFAGLVSPAQDGARVSLQRLVAGHWKRVKRTTAQPSSAGSSSYAITVHRRHGGFYRVRVRPVDGGHASGSSRSQLVSARVTA